jgi:Xaa-Pro aminopeptidase
MRAGEVALIDHSAEANYYVSDLARTVPVSGRFTPDQRLAYDTYLAAYEAGLAEIKPGVPYMNASRVAGKALESRWRRCRRGSKAPRWSLPRRWRPERPGIFSG